jgi:hypothetical protein
MKSNSTYHFNPTTIKPEEGQAQKRLNPELIAFSESNNRTLEAGTHSWRETDAEKGGQSYKMVFYTKPLPCGFISTTHVRLGAGDIALEIKS